MNTQEISFEIVGMALVFIGIFFLILMMFLSINFVERIYMLIIVILLGIIVILASECAKSR